MFFTFQFTPLREGRRGMERQQRQRWLISIHAPPRGATGTRRICGIRSANFNSRPSARGDQAQRQGLRLRRYFNSRPSARGDLFLTSNLQGVVISIHAPPRGATDAAVHVRGPERISIHAPPRGATHSQQKLLLRMMNFNSRPSARGDKRCRTLI